MLARRAATPKSPMSNGEGREVMWQRMPLERFFIVFSVKKAPPHGKWGFGYKAMVAAMMRLEHPQERDQVVLLLLVEP